MANQSKKTLSEFSLCMTNINSLCLNGKKTDLKLHTITKQNSDIHIIVDSRIDDSEIKNGGKSKNELSVDMTYLATFQKTGG